MTEAMRHLNQRTFGRSPATALVTRAEISDHSKIQAISTSVTKCEFVGNTNPSYNYGELHLADSNYECCLDIAADIEISSLIDTTYTSNSEFGNLLGCIEAEDMSNNSPPSVLPELDQDTLSLIEQNQLSNTFYYPHNYNDITTTTDAEAMDADQSIIQEDLNGAQVQDMVSPHSIEEILSRNSDFVDEFMNMVDCGLSLKSAATSSQMKSAEVQSSTTQCNFAEDREKDRRERNNVASRKSRAMKKERFAAMQSEIEQLRAANSKLKAFVDELDSAIDEAKAIVLPPK